MDVFAGWRCFTSWSVRGFASSFIFTFGWRFRLPKVKRDRLADPLDPGSSCRLRCFLLRAILFKEQQSYESLRCIAIAAPASRQKLVAVACAWHLPAAIPAHASYRHAT